MNARKKNENPYHPDIQIFLVLIPFISAFNYYLTYSNIQLNWFLALTFSIDTVQGYLAWIGVRYLILYLDNKMPYNEGPGKRILVQLISTTILGLLIISLLTEAVSLIARGEAAPMNFYTIDLFIISIWFLVVNDVYIGIHYYRKWQQLESRQREQKRINTEGIIATAGKKDIQLRFDELLGFYVDGNYTTACNIDGKKYYLDQSLNKLEETLPVAHFFRLNRQFIVNRSLISGFRRKENGKIAVMLRHTELLPSEITVSRLKAPSFKKWFRPG